MTFDLPVMKLDDNATIPTRGSKNSAGLDLYSSVEIVIPSHGKAIVSTSIAVFLPANTYGRIAPRSGLAVKYFLDVGAGVIDEDYAGEICIVMFNFGNEDYTVKKKTRIAQLIITPVLYLSCHEVGTRKKTERGEKGFGSTGLSFIKKSRSISSNFLWAKF